MATEEKDTKDNVIAGEVNPEQTIIEQAKAARGEDDKDKAPAKEKVDTSAAEANYTDEQKSKDAAVKAKHDHLETLGLDPDVASQPGGHGMFKVEDADTKEKMYTGVVTVTGVDGRYHKKLSTRINCGSVPIGAKAVEHIFKDYAPSLDLSAGIEIDPKNEADPLLRTQFE